MHNIEYYDEKAISDGERIAQIQLEYHQLEQQNAIAQRDFNALSSSIETQCYLIDKNKTENENNETELQREIREEKKLDFEFRLLEKQLEKAAAAEVSNIQKKGFQSDMIRNVILKPKPVLICVGRPCKCDFELANVMPDAF